MEAQEIKTLRNQLGLSQRQFAKQLGVSKRTVTYWESGKRRPDINAQSKLALLHEQGNTKSANSGEQGNTKSANSGEQGNTKSANSGEQGNNTKHMCGEQGNQGNKFLKQALEYEKLGWSVVQLKARSKIPHREWKHLQQRRATPDEIRRWWTEYPNGNVGIICGSISGIAVIDIDDIDKADARVKQEMPTGYQVITKNGLHAYYTIPKGVMLQSNPKILGVELKAEGSLVAAPPSIHPEGGAYTFKMNGELRPLPQWFIKQLQQPQKQGQTQSSDNWVIEAWQGVGKGERNITAAKLAGHYFGKRLQREEVVEIMSDWNERNTPPLDHDELMTVIGSIQQTHNRNHPPLNNKPERSFRDRPAEDKSTPQPIAVLEPTTDEEAGQDEEQEHIEVKNLFPSFPHEAFRGIFEAFRLAHTETTEAADEFLFASMLSAVGSVMGRKCWVWYAHPLYPNFYVAIVGTTARARKSTAANKIRDLLQRCDPNVLYYRGLASAEGFIQILAPISADEESDFDELISSGNLPFEEAPLRYQAQKARLSGNVTSFEGFRLLCHIGEFSALLKKSLKESSSGLTEAIIDAYDNPDKLDNPTRTSPLSAPKPSVSVLTTTTTGRLLRHLMKEETEGGFANRFVYFCGDRKGPNPLPPEPRYDHLNQVVAEIVQARRRWHNTQFHLTASTQEIWDNYYHEWYYQLDNDVIDPITGRLPVKTVSPA